MPADATCKKVYGKSAMAEVMQDAINATVAEALTERSERAAAQPKVDLPEDQSVLNKVLDGESDLAFDVSYEVLPAVELMDFTRAQARPAGRRDRATPTSKRKCSACSARTAAMSPRPTTASSQTATISVSPSTARSTASRSPGGSSDHAHLIVGSGEFIPGFEEQLVGMKKGETRTIEVTFPADYNREELQGKTATFDVTILHIDAPQAGELNDEFAKRLGLDDVDALREAVKEQMGNALASMSRQAVKRQILDALDEGHKFDVPQQLVDAEFDTIWERVKHEIDRPRPHLRGRRHDRGRSPRAVPQDRRAPRAPRAGGRRDRQLATRSK